MQILNSRKTHIENIEEIKVVDNATTDRALSLTHTPDRPYRCGCV